jgi:stage II sporulation protein AA (anti-sigma F factor antagonist)
MTLHEEKEGKVFVLGLDGKIDTEGAGVFEERIAQILDDGEQYILLDFTDVAYINSSGLHALILVARRLANSGGMLVLAGVSEHIQRALKLSGLAAILKLEPTKSDALAAFADESN